MSAFEEYQSQFGMTETLHEGMRVMPNPNHENYGIWGRQHKLNGQDCAGTIISKSVGNWWNVKWDNGNGNNNYETDYLIPLYDQIEDTPIPYAIIPIQTGWQPGAKVRPNPKHEDYDGYMRQHQNNEGILYNQTQEEINEELAKENGWIRVKWSYGHVNSYHPGMLILVDEENTEIKEVNPVYSLPLLPGQKVCLNPESKAYSDLNQAIKGQTGYIMRIKMTNGDLNRWSTFNEERRRMTEYSILFENGKEFLIRGEDLLPIDAPFKTIKRITFSNGKTYCFEESDSKLDELIIDQGLKPTSTITYNDEYRSEIIQGIMNYLSKKSSNPF